MREFIMTDSKTRIAPIFRVGGIAAAICLLMCAIAARGFAQGPSAPRASQSQGTQTTPLPLSGRNGQNGSVIVVEAPIAGTTTNVNTINPTLQLHEPYSEIARTTTYPP